MTATCSLGFCNLFGNGNWLGVWFYKMRHACSQGSHSPRDFPPISPKIGEVQRSLDSAKTRFAVGFGPPMPILKNLKKQIDYLVYKMIILYLRYIATYNCGELYLGLNSGRFWKSTRRG
jgi:hypothetical protein